MKYCTECGSELEESYKFCTNCGAKQWYKIKPQSYNERKAEQKKKRKEDWEEFKSICKAVREDSNTIVKTMIIGSDTDVRKSMGSSVVRGTVGGALFGGVGAIGGALSGKNKIVHETTFLIFYKDGHKETKTVKNNSTEFNRYCNYLDK